MLPANKITTFGLVFLINHRGLSMRLIQCILLAATLAALMQSVSAGDAFPARPNIILVMTDDQGYGDLSCHGNPVLKTPNIDKFHSQSVRFTEFNVSPTCAPTRTAMFTGRHEFHSGVTHTINERERMSLKSTTLAQVLKNTGYTNGIFGKWHLGDEAEYQPGKRGFDEVFIHGGGGIGQTYKGSCGDAPKNSYFNPYILHNNVFEKSEGYCTDVFFNQAIKWIDAKRKEKTPFFAYIPTNAPHDPLHVPEKYEQMYADKVKPNEAKFFGMIANIDENFGVLMKKLEEWGMERDTLVIFMTDNGSMYGTKVFNDGMRGTKNTPWRGGTRVPAFWRWPAAFKGGKDVDRLTAHVDIFPTLAEICGAKVPDDVAAKFMGRSLVPLLKNADAPWDDRILFTHVGRWAKGKASESKFSWCRVRNSQFSLINPVQTGEKWELYDLKNDPGEKTNVIDQHPDVVKELRAAYDKWWTDVQPDLVNENVEFPKYNPYHELFWKQFGGGPPETGTTEKKN
jgi:arylsulfatase A-like enzyme